MDLAIAWSRLKSAATTTSRDPGKAEKGEGAGGRSDGKASLLAGSTKTLVPGDLKGATGKVRARFGGREATDENAETDQVTGR